MWQRAGTAPAAGSLRVAELFVQPIAILCHATQQQGQWRNVRTPRIHCHRVAGCPSPWSTAPTWPSWTAATPCCWMRTAGAHTQLFIAVLNTAARRRAAPSAARTTVPSHDPHPRCMPCSYEMPNDPDFRSSRLSLLDRGVTFAIAHVRGGGEMGRRWYETGKYLQVRVSGILFWMLMFVSEGVLPPVDVADFVVQRHRVCWRVGRQQHTAHVWVLARCHACPLHAVLSACSASNIAYRRRRTRSPTSLRVQSTWWPTSTPAPTGCASRAARASSAFTILRRAHYIAPRSLPCTTLTILRHQHLVSQPVSQSPGVL